MSIKHGLLALLERGPMYGYQLRAEFEESTGGDLAAEHRAGLHDPVAGWSATGWSRSLPEHDGGQRPYEITDAGRAELAPWFATPISRADRPRDELAIKLALALTTPGVDVPGVVQTQRTATMRMLQEYTRLKQRTGGPADLAWRLVLDSMIFRAEAEVRWLDHCEASLARHAPRRPGTGRRRRRRAADRRDRGGDDRDERRCCWNCATCTAPTGRRDRGPRAARRQLDRRGRASWSRSWGRPGSGKSTLLNLAGGLDTPTEGEVVVEGTRPGRPEPQAAGRGAAAPRRLRVPGPQPAAQPHRGRERRAAAGAGRR